MSAAGGESDVQMKTCKSICKFQKFWKKRSFNVTEGDSTYGVVYLGNIVTGCAKGDGCVDKPLSTLWKNYQHKKSDMHMRLTVTANGLRVATAEHGITEYWSNRITYCCSHPQYPKVFCWIYRHEGKKLKQELRCHAVLCPGSRKTPQKIENLLRERLTLAFFEFKRNKILRQNMRLSWMNYLCDNPGLPKRKLLLCTGSQNYKPPLERCKSAPKLPVIEESPEEEGAIVAGMFLVGDEYEEIVSNSVSECASDLGTDFESQFVESDTEIFSSPSRRASKQTFPDGFRNDVLYVGRPEKVADAEGSAEHFPLADILCDLPLPPTMLPQDTDSFSDESGYSEEKPCSLYLSEPDYDRIVFVCSL